MGKSKEEGDVASVRKAENIGGFYAVRLHKIIKIVGKGIKGKGRLSPRGFPVAAGIYGDDPAVFGKERDLTVEICAVLAVSV